MAKSTNCGDAGNSKWHWQVQPATDTGQRATRVVDGSPWAILWGQHGTTSGKWLAASIEPRSQRLHLGLIATSCTESLENTDWHYARDLQRLTIPHGIANLYLQLVSPNVFCESNLLVWTVLRWTDIRNSIHNECAQSVLPPFCNICGNEISPKSWEHT